MMRPLDGIRVLDLSRVLAGPLCTQALGDLGADIIKVEPPGVGDESRAWPPFQNGMATAFLSVNRQKRSIVVDLKTQEGLEIIHRLATSCDVVVESNATGVSERLGIDYATLRKLNPRLVYCTISGFGRTGPLRDAKGYDVILQAFSGMMGLTGEEGSGPIRSPFSPIDQTTGHHATIGIMAALMRRGQTGEGAFIEVSLFETAVALVGYLLQAYWQNGTSPRRSGSRHNGIAPYQAFDSADKPVLIGVANDRLWRKFCKSFDLDSIVDDPRFVTNDVRVANREAVAAIVQDRVGAIPSSILLERLNAIGVPCAPINSLEDLMQHDHTLASGIIGHLTHPVIGGFQSVGMPILFDSQPRSFGTPPPLLGEHTIPVLQWLGYGPSDIAVLLAKGVVHSWAPAQAAAE